MKTNDEDLTQHFCPGDRTHPDYWYGKAEEALLVAENMKDEFCRRAYMGRALDYQKIARFWEQYRRESCPITRLQ